MLDKQVLQDQIILVTGASSGIGREIALSFAAHGATIILSGRCEKKLKEVDAKIQLLQGLRKTFIYPLDLSQLTDAQCILLAETIESKYGRLDGLLHNAATLDLLKPLEQLTTAYWEYAWRVNFQAPFMMTRELLPLLRLKPRSSVLFTVHNLRKHKAYWGAYGIAKYALTELMETFMEEEEEVGSVRFNCIDPGRVNTNLRNRAYPGVDFSLLMRPEDVSALYIQIMGGKYKDKTGEVFITGPSEEKM